MMFGYATGCTKRGIVLRALRIDTELTLDLRGPIGLDPAIPPGSPTIRYTVHIAADASRAELEEVHQDVMRLSPNRYHVSNPIHLESQLVVVGGSAGSWKPEAGR